MNMSQRKEGVYHKVILRQERRFFGISFLGIVKSFRCIHLQNIRQMPLCLYTQNVGWIRDRSRDIRLFSLEDCAQLYVEYVIRFVNPDYVTQRQDTSEADVRWRLWRFVWWDKPMQLTTVLEDPYSRLRACDQNQCTVHIPAGVSSKYTI